LAGIRCKFKYEYEDIRENIQPFNITDFLSILAILACLEPRNRLNPGLILSETRRNTFDKKGFQQLPTMLEGKPGSRRKRGTLDYKEMEL
jgi:hypothetical protein